MIACKANFYEVHVRSNKLMVTQYHVAIEHPGNRKVRSQTLSQVPYP